MSLLIKNLYKFIFSVVEFKIPMSSSFHKRTGDMGPYKNSSPLSSGNFIKLLEVSILIWASKTSENVGSFV